MDWLTPLDYEQCGAHTWARLRLRVHVYGMSQTCPYDFFKNQYSGFLQVQVTEWVNGFLWIILGLYLLIESSLVRLQRARISHLRAKACIKWKLLLLEFSTSICSPRCALTTVHQLFLCLWDSITGPHEEFLTEKYSSLSLFAYKVRGYLLWENLTAFQALQLCSSPTCEQKRFVWPCSKLLWFCLSCK